MVVEHKFETHKTYKTIVVSKVITPELTTVLTEYFNDGWELISVGCVAKDEYKIFFRKNKR